MNKGYLARQTGFHPYKEGDKWVLNVEDDEFYSYKIKESLAFDELYDQFWDYRRHQAMNRDNYTCRMCGARNSLSVDHIKSRGAGGTDELSNLRTLCLDDHNRRHSYGWKEPNG